MKTKLNKYIRSVKLIPLLKPNKLPHEIYSYCPMSLTSVLGKIMQRMINNRLQKELLSPQFTSNRTRRIPTRPLIRGTEERLAYLAHSIHSSFSNEQHQYFLILSRPSTNFEKTNTWNNSTSGALMVKFYFSFNGS